MMRESLLFEQKQIVIVRQTLAYLRNRKNNLYGMNFMNDRKNEIAKKGKSPVTRVL